jgi:hypothetical protein
MIGYVNIVLRHGVIPVEVFTTKWSWSSRTQFLPFAAYHHVTKELESHVYEVLPPLGR